MLSTTETRTLELQDLEGAAEWQAELMQEIKHDIEHADNTFIEWNSGSFIRYLEPEQIHREELPIHQIPNFLAEHPNDPDAGLMQHIYEIELKTIKPDMRTTAGHIRSIFYSTIRGEEWLVTVVAYHPGSKRQIKQWRSTKLTSPEDVWQHAVSDVERADFADHVGDDKLSVDYRRLWIECEYAKRQARGNEEAYQKALQEIHDDEEMQQIMNSIYQH